MERKTQSQTAKDFVLETAEISSSFFKEGAVIDITDVVTDIDVYEHIDKPYVTGTVTFVDASRIYEFSNFYGIEKFTMKVKLPEAAFPVVEKTFYVDKVVKNIRTNDGQAVIVLHLLEEVGYLSEMININRSYYGKGYRVIANIVKEYLGKDLSKPQNAEFGYEDNQDTQPEFGVVIPNMRPLKAAEWIKDRITTSDAAPFYFFSTFTNNTLHLLPLSKMLEANALNATTQPFRYSQAYINTENLSIEQQAFIIESYDNPINEEILKINGKGFLNSTFAFHDVTRNQVIYPGHRPEGGANKNRWTAYDMFQQRGNLGRALGRKVDVNQVYPVYAELPLKANEPEQDLLHLRPSSKVVTSVYSTELYDNGIHTLNESRSQGEFLQRLDSKGLRNWVVSAPLNFSVPGRNFLLGGVHTTIGNKYNLVFLTTSAHDNVESTTTRDSKKSGEYLIYAARHSFAREGYMIHLTGTKIVDDGDVTDYIPPIPNEIEALPLTSTEGSF